MLPGSQQGASHAVAARPPASSLACALTHAPVAALALGALLAVAPGARADDTALREEALAYFAPIPMNPPEIAGNVTTRARVALGAQLLFDPLLSRSSVFSCNSCHNVGMGGVDGLETSIGHGWQKGPRNAPTVCNSVFNVAQFWDGRAADLREQAKGPMQAGVEMNNTPERVEETLRSMPGYVAAFADASRARPTRSASRTWRAQSNPSKRRSSRPMPASTSSCSATTAH